MSQFTGMDIQQVKDLAVALHGASVKIDEIINTLNPKIQHTNWVGADQKRFVSDWQSHHVKNLNIVKQALADASTLANREAKQQEDASNT